jgi:hypothetical protein
MRAYAESRNGILNLIPFLHFHSTTIQDSWYFYDIEGQASRRSTQRCDHVSTPSFTLCTSFFLFFIARGNIRHSLLQLFLCCARRDRELYSIRGFSCSLPDWPRLARDRNYTKFRSQTDRICASSTSLTRNQDLRSSRFLGSVYEVWGVQSLVNLLRFTYPAGR